jgi:membrane protein YqaA with SNARE-associated domain
MTLLEAYAYLLVDCFTTMLLLPLQYNFVIVAMKIFGTYNPFIISAVGAFGAGLGACANWLLGKVINKAMPLDPESERAKKLLKFLKDKSAFFLLFSFIPFLGSIITVAYGAIVGKFRLLFPIVFASHIAYFLLFMLVFK